MRLAVAALLLTLVGACLGGAPPPRGSIGAILGRTDDGRTYIRSAPERLAAAQAGLEEGDEILLIDGVDVRDLNDEQLRKALSGKPDSTMRITAVRRERVIRVEVKRTKVLRRRRDAGAPPG